MSSSKNARPKWWQLYLVLPLLIVLFILEVRLPFSTTEHEIAQLGILAVIYGLVHLWLRANRSAFYKMDIEKEKLRASRVVKIYEVPRSFANEFEDVYEHRPMFRITDHEIKNTLSDTFEMDTEEHMIDPSKIDVSKN